MSRGYEVAVGLNAILCPIDRNGMTISFFLDKKDDGHDVSRKYLNSLRTGWKTRFVITRGEVKGKDVRLYGYLPQAGYTNVKRERKVA